MEEYPTVWPHGRDTWPNGPPTVVIKDKGCEILLMFDPDAALGEGGVVELRVLPDAGVLEPRVLRRVAPQAELYVKAARHAIKLQREDLIATVAALRKVGRPGRGLTDEFYETIAQQYNALVEEAEKHPIKSLGEIHNATISAASRWVKEARRRNLIKEEGSGQ